MIPYIHQWPCAKDSNVIPIALYRSRKTRKDIDEALERANRALAWWRAHQRERT